jgi:hypothetical protein
MGILTGTEHGEAANRLLGFYSDKVIALENTGEYFMAAIALGFALETALLTYLLIEFGPDNGGPLEIPDRVGMKELIMAANQIDVLNAPIGVPSHLNDDDDPTPPKHVAKEVVGKIQALRNMIHPARALRRNYDPHTFSREQFEEYKAMYKSVMHSLLYYL